MFLLKILNYEIDTNSKEVYCILFNFCDKLKCNILYDKLI